LFFTFFARCANNARCGESHESKGMPSKTLGRQTKLDIRQPSPISRVTSIESSRRQVIKYLNPVFGETASPVFPANRARQMILRAKEQVF
jgi:hypothetical protein